MGRLLQRLRYRIRRALRRILQGQEVLALISAVGHADLSGACRIARQRTFIASCGLRSGRDGRKRSGTPRAGAWRLHIIVIMPHPMRLRQLPIILLVVLLQACSASDSVAPEDGSTDDGTGTDLSQLRMQVAGYHVSWMERAWTEYDFDLLDVLFFFDLPVDPDGRLADTQGWPHAWVDLIAEARSHDVPIHLTISILEADVFHSVFSSAAHVEQLLSGITGIAASGSVGGIHLDVEIFEPMTPGVRGAYTRFVQSLRERLRSQRPDVKLSVFLTALDTSHAYDEAALAAASDFVVVQGYDMHWLTGDTAGPLSPIRGWAGRSWDTILSRYDALGIDRRQMLFAVPYYGYEWPTQGPLPGARTAAQGVLTTFAPALAGVSSARERALEHGLRRDSVSGSPWYLIEDSTGWRQGWFEDAASLGEKYDFTREQGLAGVAIFPLSYGDRSLDSTLRAARWP